MRASPAFFALLFSMNIFRIIYLFGLKMVGRISMYVDEKTIFIWKYGRNSVENPVDNVNKWLY